jgi:hypothetical protein
MSTQRGGSVHSRSAWKLTRPGGRATSIRRHERSPACEACSSTQAASFRSDMLHPNSLSAADRPGGRCLCTARTSVPPSTGTSSAQRRIVGLELDHLHDAPVGNERHEATVERIGMRGGFAALARRVIRQRDAKGAAFACVESVDVASHFVRDHPGRDGGWVEQCLIDARG